MQERREQASAIDDVMPVAIIGLLGGLRGPRRWEARLLGVVEIARVLI